MGDVMVEKTDLFPIMGASMPALIPETGAPRRKTRLIKQSREVKRLQKKQPLTR
jgi:hypothetical protein